MTKQMRIFTIGYESTTVDEFIAALREAGVEPDLEADPHTPDGLVAALVADAAR